MNIKDNLKIVVIGIVAILLVTIIVIVLPKPTLKNKNDNNNNNPNNIQTNDEEYVSNEELIIDNIDFGKLFYDAEKLYASFTSYGTFKTSGTFVFDKESNNNYYLVTDTKYDTLDKIRNELNKYFTSSIVDNLLKAKVENYLLYKEIDGKLYRFGGYAGQYGYTNRENNLSVRKISDEKFIIHDKIVFGADTSMEKEGTYEHDYAIQKEGDNYKFVNFELPVTFYENVIEEKS